MTEPQNREDRILQAVMERLEAVRPFAEPEATSVEEQTLERLYVELLGLLPYSLTPEAPDSEAKQRLLSAIGAGDATSSAGPSQADPRLNPQPSTAAVAASEPVADASPSPAGIANSEDWGEVVALPSKSAETRRPVRRFGGRWLIAASALIALATSGAAGWFFGQLQTTRQESAVREAAIDLMASQGAEVCPLRPTADAGASNNEEAFAVLFMHPQAESWFLRASNLAPLAEGEQYRIWFETDQGPVAVGDLFAGPTSQVEIAADSMGSRLMHGVIVTVEQATASADVPSGRSILHGTAAEMFVL